MEAKIPDLYRGDSDPQNKRKIHQLYNPNINGGFSSSNLLISNLNNSGNGKEIFNSPFHNLVIKHVGSEWHNTHFLSFSECEERAKYYGSEGGKNYIPYIEGDIWGFFILTLSLNKLQNREISEIASGIYKVNYQTCLQEFNFQATILLINVIKYFTYLLNENVQFSETIFLNAKTDKEWLILPVNSFSNQYSFKIAADIVSKIEYYIFQ